MTKTHRVDPLNPRHIPSPAYASEYALAIVNNLTPETIAKPDFWTRSAQALRTATIWYLSRYYPSCCTLPHVINMIVYKDYQKLLDRLRQDYQCASMIRSITTAIDMEAANQTAGTISTLQLGLGRINTPEICYVLSGDEFSLDVNDLKAPKMLCVGTSPTLAGTFAPVIFCLATVALKLMNQQGKHHSYVLLDEGSSLNLGLDGRTAGGSTGNSVNYSLQERNRIYPEELLNLEVGHFIGTTVETASPHFPMYFAEPTFRKGRFPRLRTPWM